jgi:hypothetical protein
MAPSLHKFYNTLTLHVGCRLRVGLSESEEMEDYYVGLHLITQSLNSPKCSQLQGLSKMILGFSSF